ncbi:MAG TPA: H-type lectin domain-containing protein [Granulicella sp.]
MTCTGSLRIEFKAKDFASLLAQAKRAGDSPVVLPVTFPRQFSSLPCVLLGVSGFDGGGEAFRFRFEPANVTETGFDLLLFARRSWIDSIDISWLATDA